MHRLLKPGAARKSFLLAASYYFYSCWDWRFLGLILASTLVDFLAGKKIYRAQDEKSKQRWLGLSLFANLGILAFFKYFNFFAHSLVQLLQGAGLEIGYSTLNIVLPVGISFYTFQTLSYSIDIYRGRLKPTQSFLDFSLFVAFFPQLVAGPIVRASEFLPQLEEAPRRKPADFFEGLERFLVGLVKKVLIADIAAGVVDPVFNDPTLFSGAACAAGALAFTIQIYFDFSGYSDMAIGLAGMLGFRLPANFRLPYLSTSMTDFWRRWHISLSSWFRDYLYIPLGGNRRGTFLTYRNLAVTFLLTGLWHGANWTFVAFGLWNGLLLLSERVLFRGRERLDHALAIRKLLGFSYCLTATVIAFAVFRSPSISAFFDLAGRVLRADNGADVWFSPLRFAYVLGAAVVYHGLSALHVRRKAAETLDPWFWRPFFYMTVLLVLLAYAPLDKRAFIYFAF